MNQRIVVSTPSELCGMDELDAKSLNSMEYALEVVNTSRLNNEHGL
jgi:hypothetical protein